MKSKFFPIMVCVAWSWFGGGAAGEEPMEAGSSVFYVDGFAVDGLGKTFGRPESDFEDFELTPLKLSQPGQDAFHATVRLAQDAPEIIDADRLSSYLEGAEASASIRNWDGVQRAIDSALRMSPSSPYILGKAALLFSRGGQYERAEHYFRRYVGLVPADLDFIAGWGAVLIRLKRYHEAESILARGARVDPKHLMIQFNQEVLRVVRDQPAPDPNPWPLLSTDMAELTANWLHGDRENLLPVTGQQAYEELCHRILGPETYTNLPRIVHHLAVSQNAMRDKEWETARTGLEQLKELGVIAIGVNMNLLQVYMFLERPKDALRLAARMAIQHPDNPSVQYNYGSLLAGVGAYKRAVVPFSKAYLLSPDWADVQFALAYVYAGMKQMDQVWPILNNMARTSPRILLRKLAGKGPVFEVLKAAPEYATLQALLRENLVKSLPKKPQEPAPRTF